MVWRAATGVVSAILTMTLVAIFLIFLAKPTANLPYEPWINLALIGVIEAAAFGAGAALTMGGWRGAIVKALVSALVTSFILTYILKPSAYGGFDIDFLILLGFQFVGLGFAALLTMRPDQQQAARGR